MTEKNAAIDEYLERIEDLLDNATKIPLMGGKCVVDAAEIMALLADVRSHLPGEIRQAQALVADRVSIIATAKKEAEDIVAQAEARAKQLISQEEIVKQAEARVEDLRIETDKEMRAIRKHTLEYSDKVFKNMEDTLVAQVKEMRAAKARVHSKVQPEENAE